MLQISFKIPESTIESTIKIVSEHASIHVAERVWLTSCVVRKWESINCNVFMWLRHIITLIKHYMWFDVSLYSVNPNMNIQNGIFPTQMNSVFLSLWINTVFYLSSNKIIWQKVALLLFSNIFPFSFLHKHTCSAQLCKPLKQKFISMCKFKHSISIYY